jgi:hypothetical protein
MKLDKKMLKQLILETLREAEIPKDGFEDDPEYFPNTSTDRTYEAPSGPVPESMGLMDIAGYFHQVADDMKARIDQLESMKTDWKPNTSDEETAAALKDMADVQRELQDIQRSLAAALEGLKK